MTGKARPTSEAIMDVLMDGPAQVGEIAAELGMRKAPVEFALHNLDMAGLIEQTPDGWQMKRTKKK